MTIYNPHTPGRKPIHDDAEFYRMILQQYEHKSLRDLARYYNVSRTTISNWLKKGRALGVRNDEHDERKRDAVC